MGNDLDEVVSEMEKRFYDTTIRAIDDWIDGLETEMELDPQLLPLCQQLKQFYKEAWYPNYMRGQPAHRRLRQFQVFHNMFDRKVSNQIELFQEGNLKVWLDEKRDLEYILSEACRDI